MRGLVVALLVLAACPGQGPQRLGTSPSWRGGPGQGSQLRPVTFAPSSEPRARRGRGSGRNPPDSGGVVVFALQGSGVSTLPTPRAVPAGGRATIDAVIDARYHDPEVFVTYEAGATELLDLDTKAGRPGGF